MCCVVCAAKASITAARDEGPRVRRTNARSRAFARGNRAPCVRNFGITRECMFSSSSESRARNHRAGDDRPCQHHHSTHQQRHHNTSTWVSTQHINCHTNTSTASPRSPSNRPTKRCRHFRANRVADLLELVDDRATEAIVVRKALTVWRIRNSESGFSKDSSEF